MQKTRILVDARCLEGEGQGMLTYIVGLYRALSQEFPEHYDIFIASFDTKVSQDFFDDLENIHHIEIPRARKIKLLSYTFPKIIQQYRIDFAHFQYVTPFRKNCKHIVTTHDILFMDFPEVFRWSYRIKRAILFKYSLKTSDIRLTVSNYSKHRIGNVFGIPEATIHVTPNAVNPIFLKPYNKIWVQQEIKNKFGFNNYLLYVSRIEERKNHQLLLDAYDQLDLAAQGIQLVFVGNNTLGNQQLGQNIITAQKKHPEHIHWLTYVEESDLINLYRAARAFVFPSIAEGFGIPPIEAAATGLEVLCSNTTAMGDFTFLGNHLFHPNDSNTFLQKLKTLILKTSKVQQNTGYQKHIREHYHWGKAAKVLHHSINDSLV